MIMRIVQRTKLSLVTVKGTENGDGNMQSHQFQMPPNALQQQQQQQQQQQALKRIVQQHHQSSNNNNYGGSPKM